MSGANGLHSPLKAARMNDSMPHPPGPHPATNSNSTADSENQMSRPYIDSITGEEAISRMEVDFPNMNTSGALLDDDDAISAAMEAIAEANRFNTNLADSEADTDCTDSRNRQSLKPLRSTNHKDSTTFNYECEKLEVVQIGMHPGCSTDSETPLSTAVHYCNSNPVYLVDSTEFHDCGTPENNNNTGNTNHAVSELAQTTTLSPKLSTPLLPSPGETFLHSNWRPILRPIFERVVIERLWTHGELGASNPQALLLTMWFFISRHFGIGCRTDHARLVLGNLQVETDPKSDANCLVFVRPSGKDSRKTSSVPRYSTHSKYPDARLPARTDCVDRCPVHLFEQFRARRPVSAHDLNTPLYLQPERTALALQSRSKFAVWFTPNALGKNRIGSMLNMALLKLGMPVGRQVNLMRFCDALAATAITPAGGEAGSRLVQLMSDAHLDAVNFDRELTACAEHVVDQACIHGSALHRALASASEGSVTINTASGCASVASGTRSRTVRSTNLTDETTTLPRVRFVPIRPISTERNATMCSTAGENPVPMSLIGSKLEDSVTGATSIYVPHTPQFNLMPFTPSMNNLVTESIPAFGTSGDNLTILMKTEGLPERSPHEVHTKAMKFERHPLFALDNQAEQPSLTHASDTTHNLLVANQLRNESGLFTGCSRSGDLIEHTRPAICTTSLPCSSVFVLGSQSAVPLMVPSPHLLSNSVASATTSASSTTITATTTTTVGTTDVVPIASGAADVSLQTSSAVGQPQSCPLPVSENEMNIPQLVGSSQLIPITLLSAMTSVKPSSSCSVQASSSISNSQVVIPTRHDDIQLDYRKSGTGYARSVPLELRELLDVVLTVAQFVPSPTSPLKCKLFWPGSNSTRISRPPVGLVTQLLWRARALDDRGPWILTFSMWWLMQHYFGIGSRSHHVRLRWSNLRLVTGVIDPITGRSCEALEYAGPPEYTTVKAFALLESTGDGGQPVRRVYPSSGWAEAEIHVASVLAADAPDKRPRIRPLDTGPDVPGLTTRDGPDFVALYKAFCAHRPSASRQSDSPFYVQPLHCKPTHWGDPVTTPWFGLDALGKNRIGALMRNIVDKVVRVNLARVARAATVAAKHSCIEVVKRAVLSMPQTIQSPQSSTSSSTSDMIADLITRRQLLVDRLADLLGLSSVMVTESGWLDQLNASTRVTAIPLTTLSTQSGHAPEMSDARLNEVQTSISSPTPVTGLVNLTDRLKDTVSGSQTSPVLQIITEQSGAVMLHPQVLEPETGSRMSTQVVLLTANQSTTSSTTSHSLITPTTSTQAGLILIPATLASTPDQHDLLSPGSLLAGAVQRVEPQQSVPTSATIVNASTDSLLKPTDLLNRATSATLGQSVAYLTQTSNQAPVNLLLLNPSPISTVTTVTHPAHLSTNAGSSKTHSADATTLSLQNGTPTYSLIGKTDVNCLAHSRSSSNANPVFLYGNPSADLIPDHTIKLEQTPQSNAILEQVYRPCSAFTQAMDTPAQSVMLSNATLTPSQPTVSSLLSFNPNSISVSIPTDTMRMNPFPMMNTIRVDHGDSTGESTRASSSNSRDPLSPSCVHPLQSNTYYTMTNPCMRYIIPPPSASLLPGKPTPMSESLPTLSVVLDPQTGNTNTALTNPDQNLDAKQADSNRPSDTYQQASSYGSESTSASRTRTTIGSLIPMLSLSEMTCHTTPPEPGPDQLLTLQTLIDQAWACHCRDFRGYVEQLFRTGLLSASSPWCLNFSAWFINSVAFEVENRAEHVSLRWGDFRLCQTADGSTEYLYFINRTTHRAYYLAASAPSPHSLGHNPNTSSSSSTTAVDQETVDDDVPICCPCPVAIFKALRDHRPLTCLDPYSKFYLQPRFQDPIDRNKLSQTPSTWLQVSMQDREWFLERPWGKNRVGSLFTEATKLAGLPMICLRKHRARVAWPNSINDPNVCSERKPIPSMVGRDAVHRDGSGMTTSTDFAKRSGLLDNHPNSKRAKISHGVPVTCSSLSSQSADIFSVGTTSTSVQLPSSSTILRQSPASCSSSGD